jgi:hypothetical protein
VKAEISDEGVLEGIAPLALAAYLRGRGWTLNEQRRRYTLWTATPHASGEFEVLLPTSERVRDYALRVSALLSVLASFEDRSQLAIVHDLAQTVADVVRFGLAADEAEGGEVPIDYGVRLLQTARDAMLAAACAAVDPRPVYHTRKPAQATNYLARLRLGQTEVGSYVVTLLSKVPPALHAPDNGQLFEAPEEPFNRKVVTGLHTALGAAKDTAEQVQITGELEPFRQAVDAGVSANLCAALAGLGEQIDLDGLDVSFSWAPSRPIQEPRAPVIRFSPSDLTILDEAGRWLKELGNVIEDYVLHGSVISLASEDAEEGSIVVAGLVEDKPRRVHIDLQRPWYRVAIECHRNHELVRAVGDIAKIGRRWVMTTVQAFGPSAVSGD